MEQVINEMQLDDEIIVRIGNRMTIDSIAEITKVFRKDLTEATAIAIEFEPNIVMDITALQVLCSACKTASAEGKRLMRRGTIPQALLNLLSAAGVERQKHCPDNNNYCFFQNGGL